MSKHRRPHGQYVRNTPDWFVWNLQSSGGFVAKVAAQYSQVALYNDAGDGSTLHVVGMTAATTTATAAVAVFVYSGFFPPLVGGSVARNIANLGALAGQVWTHFQPAVLSQNFQWFFGPGPEPGVWPYDYPIAILPPGYSLVCQPNAVNSDCTVGFQWLVMGKNEGYF